MAVLVFLVSIGFVVYIVFGYPLALELRARLHSRPIRRQLDENKTVTVLLAVYNGEKWLRSKLESILALDYPRDRLQILVLSDGSTDGTGDIVRQFPGVEFVQLPRGGKAAALNAGIRLATGDILFFTDVRQPLDPQCLKSLVSCLGDPEIGAACGHVYFIGDETGAHMGLYWRYEKWIRRNHTRIDSIQAGTGCIYALRRDLAVPIPPDALLDDSYLPIAAFFRGYRFVLDDGAVAYEYPTSLDTEFRRKVRTLAGIYQLVGYFPALLGPANRMWIHFASHKLGRLLLPFGLIAAAISSFGLPGTWAPLAISAQAAFYGLAVLDHRLPESFPLKRLSSVAHTFVVLMAASFCAVSIFFVPARNLWKETRVTAPKPLS